MADYINNVAAGDGYTDACSIGPDFQADSAVITIANNPALMQFAVRNEGGAGWRWMDEREFLVPPQSFKVGGIIGCRFRNATPGVVARVLAILSGGADPKFESGVPFTGILSASGGITPGGSSVEVDHNGAAIGTEPKVDLEDGGPIQWTVVDDPTNQRTKITPVSKFLISRQTFNSAGVAVAGGSEASPTQIVALGSQTYTGDPIYLEFHTPRVVFTGAVLVMVLYDGVPGAGGTEVGTFDLLDGRVTATSLGIAYFARIPITPSAGSHNYIWCAYTTVGTAQIVGSLVANIGAAKDAALGYIQAVYQ